MGRAPCCDKANVKRGPWSPEEDAKLKSYIEQHGTGGNWIALPQKIGLKRCGKSCRLRWLNYLRPNLKHGSFSEEEDNIICSLYIKIGSRWSIIAAQLPGRTDNDIKNYWNTKLKKKLQDKQRKEQQAHARRVFSLNQEIKRDLLPTRPTVGVVTQTPYWHTEHSFPIPFSNDHQKPYTNVVTGNMNSQYSCDIYFPQDQLYPSTMNMITPEGMVSVTDGTSTGTCCTTTNISPGFGNFVPNDLSELAIVNQHQIDGSVRGFHGIMESIDVASGSTNSTSTESTSWGDISCLVYSPLVSDYEGCQQRISQHVAFDESRYFGMQITQ